MSHVLAIAALLIKEVFRKKDFYAALILIAVILLYAAQLEFYREEKAVRYLMDLGLSLIFYFSVILTASLAARQVPSEIQNRTCQVLLAKPISRLAFVKGKFLGSFFGGGVSFLIFYAVFFLMVQRKAVAVPLDVAAQTFYLFLLNLFVVAAMASGLSYVFTTSANISVTFILYLLINTYGPGLKQAGAALAAPLREATHLVYYLLPHFEFFDMRQRFVHHWGTVPADLVLFLTAYALLYSFIFLFLGWLRFRKTPL